MLLAALALVGQWPASVDGRSAAPTPARPEAASGLYSITIELYPGWNLIGVPREIDVSGDSYPRLKTAGGYKAWYYWPADGYYYGTNRLYPGWGYWVESDERQTWDIGLYIWDLFRLSSVTITVEKGWNLVSVPREVSLGQLRKEIKVSTGDDGAAAWYYYPPDRAYYGTTSSLYPCWGYWLYSDEKATFTLGRELILLPTATPPPATTTPMRFGP